MSGAGFIVPAAGASFDLGFNFRATAEYVTDGDGRTYVISTDTYPVTRAGVTFGFVDDTYFNGNGRNRDNTNDPRLAGMLFQDVGGISADQRTFRVDVPSGTYSIEIAAGDDFGAQHVAYLIKDDSTTRFTFTDTLTTGADRYLDSEGAEYTNATWPGSHGTHTGIVISSGIFRLELTDLGTTSRVITHLRIVKTA